MQNLYIILAFSTFAGTLLFITSFLKLDYLAELLSFISSLLIFIFSIKLFFVSNVVSRYFYFDALAKFIVLFITFFGLIICLYSISSLEYYLKDKNLKAKFYSYAIFALGSSVASVCSNNFVLFITFWGLTGLFLYLILNLTSKSAPSAKKSFIIIGATDSFLILGLAIVWLLTNKLEILDVKLSLDSNLAIISFLCLLSASFAKAGAFPLHTWIPDMAKEAPVQASAFLPASLDKLLGIYFLVRICYNIFVIDVSISIFLMVLGALTIIFAVFMAMVQHDYKKLLSYHAVSQVGYMVLGIGCGNPLGVAGGIFHMLNNAIYKTCLFLSCSSVEQKANTDELSDLGGYAKVMPITFLSFIISALAISGIPPLNGFFSKWLVYQAVVQKIQSVSNYKQQIIIILCLISAMFGSALTLASFIKLTAATFLGKQKESGKEIYFNSWISTLILAVLCLLFGIFATQIPLKYFIFPSVETLVYQKLNFIGLWQPQLATFLIVIGIIIGLVIYFISTLTVRTTSVYLLGELKPEQTDFVKEEFYNTIKEISGFKLIYYLAEQKFFDIYFWFRNLFLGIGSILSFLHNGNLHFYLSWLIIGLVVLILFGVKI